MSPALAGRFSTTAPPGKPHLSVFIGHQLCPRHCLSPWYTLSKKTKISVLGKFTYRGYSQKIIYIINELISVKVISAVKEIKYIRVKGIESAGGPGVT